MPTANRVIVGAPQHNDEDEIVAAFAATLDLDKKVDPRLLASDDIELCLHQLETLRALIWGNGLDPFVRFYARRFLPNGPTMDSEHLEECLAIATDDYVMNGTRLLIRRTLDSKVVSLNEMVENVFKPKSKEYSDYRERLRNNILFRMRDLGLWSFTELKGTSKRGIEYHAGFRITAGPTLFAFHRHVYIPMAKLQTKFAAELVARMEN